MMLNKLPVLDKGHVAIVDSVLGGKVLGELQDEHFGGKINKSLLDSASLTLQIRCPVFFQLYLQQFDTKVVNTIESEIECYLPDVSELKTGNNETDREIHEHMKNTMDALSITSKAFEKDGLDRFMSHNLMPISVYNTIIG